MPLEDIAVRLIHSFGDLTLAFNLLPKASQVNQTQSRIGSPKLRSVSPQYQGKARRGQLPGAHKARKADIGAEARQVKINEVDGSDVYALSERQWYHALRGSSQRRLWSDSDAKAEAVRQVAWQSQRSAVAAALGIQRPQIEALHSLFPNLSERLCIAKTAFQPFEAMMVRASLTPHGFFGHRMAKDVPVSSVSARHFIKGDVTALCGSKPFVAVVALGAEKALADGGEVEMEYQACLEGATTGTAVAMLRAPGLDKPACFAAGSFLRGQRLLFTKLFRCRYNYKIHQQGQGIWPCSCLPHTQTKTLGWVKSAVWKLVACRRCLYIALLYGFTFATISKYDLSKHILLAYIYIYLFQKYMFYYAVLYVSCIL